MGRVRHAAPLEAQRRRRGLPGMAGDVLRRPGAEGRVRDARLRARATGPAPRTARFLPAPGPPELSGFGLGESDPRAGAARQPHRPPDALRLRRRAGAQYLGRLRLREAGQGDPVHRGLRPRLGPGDPPLVQPGQRVGPGDHPLPQRQARRGERHLAELVLLRPRQSRDDRLGRGLVRRGQAPPLARSLQGHAQGAGRRAGPEAGRREMDSRRRGHLLFAPVDPGLVVPGYRAARQDLGQSRRRPPARHVAQRPQGVGIPARRLGHPVQLPRLRRADPPRGPRRVQGPDPPGLLRPLRRRGPSHPRVLPGRRHGRRRLRLRPLRPARQGPSPGRPG